MIFSVASLADDFEKLKTGAFEDKQLVDFINRALDDLARNPECGIKIPSRIWPKEYVRDFAIKNLYKYDLPNGWRLIYFIRGSELEVLAIVLEWMSHKEYERRFGY